MSYRAPVADMAFTLRHVAGLDAGIAEGLYGDLTADDRRGDPRGGRPLRGRGDRAAEPRRRPARRAARRTASSPCRRAGSEAYAAWTEGGWNGLPAVPTMAARACRSLLTPPAPRCGTPPPWPSGSARCSPWAASRRWRQHGSDELKDALSREARLGRVDRDHEPDRAAGRLRPRGSCAAAPSRPATAPTGSPARRSTSPMASTTSPTTSSTSCWRACRRAGRHARHLAVPGAEGPAGRDAATTCAAPASSTSSASTARRPAHGLRRSAAAPSAG